MPVTRRPLRDQQPGTSRRTIKDKAVSQQYLTPQEEKAVVDYALRMSRKGWPVPVKMLRSLAFVIRRQRNSIFQIPSESDGLAPPGKNWPQGFYKRHPELKPQKVKALDWKRHEHHIYDKVVEWFAVIGQELAQPNILPENVYNMDETGILLSVLNSLKVLVGRDESRRYRGAGVQRTLITAIECISADGRALHPLIIWPAATHRSMWTAHPTPGWHFACSKTGYTDTAISLYWIEHVFDASTRDRARGNPRILISDGFGTHESLEMLTYCFQNNIILCRLPSHTSHKLQPCDVGVFGPLKTAYREQVEHLYRGGANTIGKQHFTLLYSKARRTAFTQRNIRASWAKAGLFPFDPDRALRGMSRPVAEQPDCIVDLEAQLSSPTSSCPLRTPTTCADFGKLRSMVQTDLDKLDDRSQARLQKLWNATEKLYADRAMLVDENTLLFEQNSEKRVRETSSATMVGRAKVMSYQDIVEAQEKRSAARVKKAGKGEATATMYTPPTAQMLCAADEEALAARREITSTEMADYCHVLNMSSVGFTAEPAGYSRHGVSI